MPVSMKKGKQTIKKNKPGIFMRRKMLRRKDIN